MPLAEATRGCYEQLKIADGDETLMTPGPDRLDDLSPRDVAAYVRDVAEQLAIMAREMGLEAVATPLDEARRAAAAALQGKAAPDDAA